MASAVVLTLYRELVKDMEDVKGQKATGLRTLPAIGAMLRLGTSLLRLPWFRLLLSGRCYGNCRTNFKAGAGYGATVLLPLGLSIMTVTARAKSSRLSPPESMG